MAYILKIIIITLLCSYLPVAALADTPIKESGDSYYKVGQYWLHNGDPRQAILAFKSAQSLYYQAGEERIAEGVYVDISQSQQLLGQYKNACWSLLNILPFDSDICKHHIEYQFEEKIFQSIPNDLITISALQSMGIISQKFSKYKQSLELINHAIKISQVLDDKQVILSLKLAKANTLQARLSEAIEHSKYIDPVHLQESYRYLNALADQLLTILFSLSHANEPSIALRADVSYLSAHILISSVPDLFNDDSLTLLDDSLTEKIDRIFNDDFNIIPGSEGIILRLKVVDSVLKYKDKNSRQIRNAYQISNVSYKLADQLKSKYHRSLALGYLGYLEVEIGNVALAQKHFLSARNLAVANFEPSLAYKWDWQLAKTYVALGNFDAAGISYKNALQSLNEVRSNLLGNPSALQSSYRNDVEPIYNDYLRFLFDKNEQNLEEIINVYDEYQQVSIENFLRCGKLDFASIRDNPEYQTVVYFIDLETEYYVVVKTKDELKYFKANAEIVRESINFLNSAMQNKDFYNISLFSIQRHANLLYQQLFAPAEHWITDDSFTYVGTGPIETIPLAIFYDGQQYLVERFSLAASLGSHLVFEEKQSVRRSAIATVGHSPLFDQLGLERLPAVYDEVANIKMFTGDVSILIDQQFKLKTLRNRLQKGISFLHIATHGQFSSDPDRTFLLAWDKPIKVRQFDSLLIDRIATKRSPLDLLVLSACQTAKGDPRARLGLAGIAIQTGARSTLASQWLINDRSTSVLMTEFYRGFTGKHTKAEALQQAQLKLLESPEYSHPYYWAAFILVGDGR